MKFTGVIESVTDAVPLVLFIALVFHFDLIRGFILRRRLRQARKGSKKLHSKQGSDEESRKEKSLHSD